MTEYSDISQVTALQGEQQNIGNALTLLDDYDGTVLSCVIAGTAPSPPFGFVTVAMTDPAQAMISGVRAGLIQRYNAINGELRDLGITNTPPNHAGGGPPAAETQPA